MSCRLGIVTQKGLGENIREACTHPIIKYTAIGLTVSAIVIGNAAYQSGNILGASLGLSNLFSDMQITPNISLWPFVIGLIAFAVLINGSYKIIERALMVLVGLMSLAFIATFIITKPELTEFFKGLFIPSMPLGANLTVIALIGTTVVPYNLFLHSSSVSKKWQSPDKLQEAKKDLYFAIPLGGLISIAIVSTAASAFFGKNISINNATDLAPTLAPMFGDYASIFIAVGLFSAGISSAITAPLAAAFALSGILNLDKNLNSISFKLIWLSILFIGILISSLGYKPVSIIWFAQVANGILLPLVAIFLVWIMNTKLLGAYKNNKMQNVLSVSVVLVTLLLSGRSLMSAFGIL